MAACRSRRKKVTPCKFRREGDRHGLICSAQRRDKAEKADEIALVRRACLSKDLAELRPERASSARTSAIE